ncbi:hypothetical protein [Pseudomonas lundensis]|uniref:hypothetical protein n=2 Tax=Pseudomonas lundensis TaxID=86185 RepID=UPI00111297E6|nr:hypothetical protein [Pseudomonas lundensis]
MRKSRRLFPSPGVLPNEQAFRNVPNALRFISRIILAAIPSWPFALSLPPNNALTTKFSVSTKKGNSMAGTISKTLHYKRAVISGAGNLQEILEKVFAVASPANKVGKRKEIVNADTDSFRVINHKLDYNGMLFFQMIMFEPGGSQAFIEMDDDADFYALDAFTNEALNKPADAEEQAKFRKEFVDSLLYFGVFDNHVVVLQSSSLRARELEAHLGWIIASFGGVPTGTAIILNDQPSQETFAKIAAKPVRNIKLGTPVKAEAEDSVPDDEGRVTLTEVSEDVLNPRKVRFQPAGMGADVIRAAMGADWFNRLDLEEDLDEANLKVSLEITYMRKTTKVGQKILDNIATSLRHVDEADIRIELEGGGTIKGGDLKLSGSISVPKLTNGLLDEGVLYHKMHGWLAGKLRSGDAEAIILPEID